MNTLHTETGIATEISRPSVKYVGWLTVGSLAIGGAGWVGLIMLLRYIIKRGKKVKDARPGISITTPPATEAVSIAEASTVARPGPSISGPTSGEAIEEETTMRSSCQSGEIVSGNNYLRHMAERDFKLDGARKPTYCIGDVSPWNPASGNISSSRHGRRK